MITSNNERRERDKKEREMGLSFWFCFCFSREKSGTPFSFWPRRLMSGSQRQNARLSMGWVITFQAFFVTASHPHESLCVTLGRFPQAFPVRILAQALEDGADCAGEPLFSLQFLGWACIQSEEGGLCWKTMRTKKKKRVPMIAHTPGHPRPFGSGMGLSEPVAEIGASGEGGPDCKRTGGLVDSAAGFWESIF